MAEPNRKPDEDTPKAPQITVRAFVIGLFLTGLFAWMTVWKENTPPHMSLTGTQIPTLPFLFLIIGVLVINPILRLVRFIRRFSAGELLIIFLMGLVSSGISTYGLSAMLVPVISGLSNEDWNTEQYKWNIYVLPFMEEHLFIAEEGTRQAAAKLRETTLELRQARKVYNAARDLQRTRQDDREIQRRYKDLLQAPDTEANRQSREAMRWQVRIVSRSKERAAARWQKYDAAYDLEAVLRTFPERIRTLQETREQESAALVEMQQDSFEQIRTFRRGLPEELRAIPGILYVHGEGFTGYRHRLRRLRRGRKALSELHLAEQALAGADGEELPAVAPNLKRAVELLDSISTIPALDAYREAMEGELDALKREQSEAWKRLRELREQRRLAAMEDFERLDAEIKDVRKGTEARKKQIKAINEELDAKVRAHLEVADRVKLTRDKLAALLAAVNQKDPPPPGAVRSELQAIMQEFRLFDASLQRFLVGDVDWSIWYRPLLFWGIIVLLTYVILMSFNVLIFRQWAHNEKLIYPLAQLPMILAGAKDDGETGNVPPVFRQGLFWGGLAVSLGILVWNYLTGQKIIPNVNPISLEFQMVPYFGGTFLDAVKRTRFVIFFSLIGLTFLIPSRISFSLWIFHIFYILEIWVLVKLGYGVDARSFQADEALKISFCNAQGAGALIVFALVVLYKCREYLFACFFKKSLMRLDDSERRELRVSSATFLVASLGLIIAFTWIMKANIFYSIFFYIMALVVTIGLTRAVAEGGILSLKFDFSPIQLLKAFTGMDKAWTSAKLMAPLWVYQMVLFFDIKTFIAPAMANSLKVRDDLRMSRWRYHVAVMGAIVLAMVVSVGATIILGYHNGANTMRGWNYHHVARSHTFGALKSMIERSPVDDTGMMWWYIAGAVLMVVILISRRHFFWVVHPIGLIMLVNPLLRGYWGSIMIGWLFKTLVSKYGNQQTYVKFRNFFIGLIAGELVATIVGSLLSIKLGGLDRYWWY